MAPYNIVFRPSVYKDLRHLPGTIVTRVMAAVESLSREPLPRQAVRLEGTHGLYRIRVGDYRIVYGVNQHMREVMIHYVRHRRDVYRQL